MIRYNVGDTGIEYFDQSRSEWRFCEVLAVYPTSNTYQIKVGRQVLRVSEEQLGEKYENLLLRRKKYKAAAQDPAKNPSK